MTDLHRLIDQTKWSHAARLEFPSSIPKSQVSVLLEKLAKRVRGALADANDLVWALVGQENKRGSITAICGGVSVSDRDTSRLKSLIEREWRSLSGGGARVERHGSPGALRRLLKSEYRSLGQTTSIQRGEHNG